MRPDLRARVLAEAGSRPSPTRAEHRRHARLLVAIAASASLVLFVAIGGVSLGSRPLALVAFSTAAALAVALLLHAVLTPPRGSMLPRPASALVAAAVSVAPLLASAALLAAFLWPEPAREPVTRANDLACAALTLLEAAPLLLVFLVARSGAEPVRPALSGLVVGITAGAWAAVMAYLRCPHAAAEHGVIAHVGPSLVTAAVSAAFGRTLLGIRSS